MEFRFITTYLLLAIAVIAVVQSQIPLPKRPLGFIYKGGEQSAPIHLTAFVDLTCPDSQQAWPTIKKVADMYGPQTMQFTVQLFPLPYHTNAFMAAQVSYYCRVREQLRLWHGWCNNSLQCEAIAVDDGMKQSNISCSVKRTSGFVFANLSWCIPITK